MTDSVAIPSHACCLLSPELLIICLLSFRANMAKPAPANRIRCPIAHPIEVPNTETRLSCKPPRSSEAMSTMMPGGVGDS